MGQYLSVRFPDELLKALDAFAQEHGHNRSEAMRLAVWQLLSASESYIAPTLPHWQTEAWTLLLRGLFGVEHLVLTDDVETLLRQAVAALNERQRRVLGLRFGLEGPRYTLAEVGAVTGTTRERVRQVEAKALRQMRFGLVRSGIWKMLESQLNEEEAQ